MSKCAGYGVRISGGTVGSPDGDGITGNLSDNQIPVYKQDTNSLEDSGFQINPITLALSGTTSIMTDDDIQSGLSTFNLGLAHRISSAGENVAFRNIVTNTAYHPTWQTSDSTGDWRSIQRTPAEDLVTDFDYQSDSSEQITNPEFTFRTLTVNMRIYRFSITPHTSIDNVILTVQQNNGTELVDYLRSRPVNLTAGSANDIPVIPFADLLANTDYRIIITSESGNVTVLGDSSGIPALSIDYRPWVDNTLALTNDLPRFSLNHLRNFAGNVLISDSNAGELNNALWNVTHTDNITENIDINFLNNQQGLEFFGVYISSASATLQGFTNDPVNNPALTRFDGQASVTLTSGQGAVYVRLSDNNYHLLYDNFSGTNIIVDPSSPGVNWDHLTFPDNRNISSVNRRWYRKINRGLQIASLPEPSSIVNRIQTGWECFIANESNSGPCAVIGSFGGNIERVEILPNRGKSISFNGSIFVEGAERTMRTRQNFRSFPENTISPGGDINLPNGNTYTAGVDGINFNPSGADQDLIREFLLNTYIRINSTSRYVVDLPLLTAGTLRDTPLNHGYEFHNVGRGTLTIRPTSNDELIVPGGRTYIFTVPMILSRNARVTLWRVNANQWQVFAQSGTIGGGFTP